MFSLEKLIYTAEQIEKIARVQHVVKKPYPARNEGSLKFTITVKTFS